MKERDEPMKEESKTKKLDTEIGNRRAASYNDPSDLWAEAYGKMRFHAQDMETELTSTQSLLKEREKEVAMLRDALVKAQIASDGWRRDDSDQLQIAAHDARREALSLISPVPYIPLSIVEPLVKALAEIAKYDNSTTLGICPYGCDTPHIAQTALTQYKQAINKE
jgi:hypothetical protein